MFKIEKHKLLINDLHRVIDNKVILFNDGDNDIIYTGTNIYSNRLLCCIMFEDDDEGFLRYINTLVSENQYFDFINKKLSFRDILNNNKTFFLVDYNYSSVEIDCNLVSIDDVPEQFLPLTHSYCPDFFKKPSFSYSLSLLGGLADLHKTDANDLSNVSTSFSDFLKSATSFLNDFNLENEIHIEGLMHGSFKINFEVNIKEPLQSGIIDIPRDKINNYINNYFDYYFNKLPNEVDNVFLDEEVKSADFKILEEELKNLYTSFYYKSKADIEQKLIDLISHSTNKLENVKYNRSFNSLKFQNIKTSGEEIPLSLINDTFISNIKNKVFNTSKFKSTPVKSKDDKTKDYKLQVYSFSTVSGKGTAYYTDANGAISKIIIHAKGRNNYENTIFTKSMDEGKPYVFKGIGEYLDNKLKKVVAEL